MENKSGAIRTWNAEFVLRSRLRAIQSSSRRWLAAFACALGACIVAPATAQVIHVRADAEGGGDGASWETALNNLHDALSVATVRANVGDLPVVWVAQGEYKPTGPGGDRTISFTAPKALHLLGGFAGTEQSADEADPAVSVTVLSGDLNGDDQPGFLNRDDNTHHILKVDAYSHDVVIDGITFRGGEATVAPESDTGGAIFQPEGTASEPPPVVESMVSRCRFLDNRAFEFGGAVVLRGNVTVRDCYFEGNSAPVGGGMRLAVIMGIPPQLARVEDCTFKYNFGGAAYLGPISVVEDCLFEGNTGETFGALFANQATVRKSTFQYNSATDDDAAQAGGAAPAGGRRGILHVSGELLGPRRRRIGCDRHALGRRERDNHQKRV